MVPSVYYESIRSVGLSSADGIDNISGATGKCSVKLETKSLNTTPKTSLAPPH